MRYIGVLFSLWSASASAGSWVLGVGEQMQWDAGSIQRFSVSGNAVRVVRVPSRTGEHSFLLLQGTRAGQSEVRVWNPGIDEPEIRKISVQAWNPPARLQALLRPLSELREAEVHWSAGKTDEYLVTLSGKIHSEAEARRIGNLRQSSSSPIQLDLEPSAELRESAIRRLRDWTQTHPFLEGAVVEAEDQGQVWVRGTLKDPTQREQVSSSLRRVYGLVELDLDALPDGAVPVHFKVYLLEVKRAFSRQLGVEWPLQGAPFAVLNGARLSGNVQWDLTLNALESEGALRVLSQPELVVRSPGEASLFAGGELPIRSRTHYQSQVQWKAIGLTLTLKTQASTRRQVRLELKSEVSQLDPSFALDDTPGISANRLSTQVDAEFERPLFLSGLLQSGWRSAGKGLPWLRQIPVLGSLFGSEDFQEERSEFVAVLLPSRVLPRAPEESWLPDRPKGPVPSPRNWLSPMEELRLRASAEFPWNALE